MGNLANKIVGAVFLLAGGILYTAERMNAQERTALSALNSSTGSSHPSTVIYHEIVPENNLFVWLFLIIGLVMLVFSFPSNAGSRVNRRRYFFMNFTSTCSTWNKWRRIASCAAAGS